MGCLKLFALLFLIMLSGCPSPHQDPVTASIVPITSGMDATEQLLIKELNQHRDITWYVDVKERQRILITLVVYRLGQPVNVGILEDED